MSWYAGFLLGLTLMLGAFLLLAAALHNVIARRPALHSGLRVAGNVLVMAGGGYLVLNTVWDRGYVSHDTYRAMDINRYYQPLAPTPGSCSRSWRSAWAGWGATT